MYCTICVWYAGFLFGRSQRQSEVGWGWLKIWSRGSFRLKGRVICSPQTGTKYGGCSEKTRCHKEKRHPTFKSDAPFWLLCKVFPDEISPRLHLHETLRVGQNRYIWQMFEAEATRHYKPQCKKAYGFIRRALISVLEWGSSLWQFEEIVPFQIDWPRFQAWPQHKESYKEGLLLQISRRTQLVLF